MRLMLDVNIFMDVILRREPHYENSALVMGLYANQEFDLFMPAHAAATIIYLTARQANHAVAVQALSRCMAVAHIAPLDESAVLRGLSYGFKDTEDAFVASVAVGAKCDYIVTRNVKDFAKSPIPAISPTELLNKIRSPLDAVGME